MGGTAWLWSRQEMEGIVGVLFVDDLVNEVIVAQYVPAYALPFIIGKRLVLDFFANFIMLLRNCRRNVNK